MRRAALVTAAAVVSLALLATAAVARPKHGHAARSSVAAEANVSRATPPSSPSASPPPPAVRSTGDTVPERPTTEAPSDRDVDVATQPVPSTRGERSRSGPALQPPTSKGQGERDSNGRLDPSSSRRASRSEAASSSSAPAPSVPGRAGATVTVASVEIEGGEVPRAQASLERLASGELGACVPDSSALHGEATLRVKFLVRGLGRVEGLDLTEARGVPRPVARCVMAALDARHLGDASDDPVALAVVFRLVPRR